MRKYIQQYYQAAKIPARQDWPKTEKRWTRIHIDFVGTIEDRMYLIVVDSHSRLTEVIPLKHAPTMSTIVALDKVFTTHGIIEVPVSDNGTQFT